MWLSCGGTMVQAPHCREYVPRLQLRFPPLAFGPIQPNVFNGEQHHLGRLLLDTANAEGLKSDCGWSLQLGNVSNQQSSECCRWPQTSSSRCTAKRYAVRTLSEDDLILRQRTPRRVSCLCADCQQRNARRSDSGISKQKATDESETSELKSSPAAEPTRLAGNTDNSSNETHDEDNGGFASNGYCPDQPTRIRGRHQLSHTDGGTSFSSSNRVFSDHHEESFGSTNTTVSSSSSRVIRTDDHVTCAELSDKSKPIISTKDRASLPADSSSPQALFPLVPLSFSSSTQDLSQLLCLPSDDQQPFVRWRSWHGKSSARQFVNQQVALKNRLQLQEITFHSQDWTDKNLSFLTPLSGFTAPISAGGRD